MIISTLLAYTGAVLGASAVVPQIIKVWRLKEAKAISYIFLLIRMAAFCCFMGAFFILGHYWEGASYILILTTNLFLLGLKVKYDRQ